MKRILFTVLVMVSSVVMSAQTNHSEAPPTDDKSVSTNSFWDNWFVQGGVQWSAFYSDEEFGSGFTKNPFKSFRSNPQISLAFGKWFTPGIGLRTKVSGIWGKAVTDSDNKGNGMKFWNAQEQVMFNVSNMIAGYNPHRIYSFILFAGAGIARNCSENIYAIGLSAGFMNQFRLSNRTALNLELGWNIAESKLDGTKSPTGKHLHKNFDNIFYAEVGVTVNIGKNRWKKTPDVNAMKAMYQSDIDALNERIRVKNEENERIRQELTAARNVKPEKECHIIEKVSTSPLSIFFGIGEYEISDEKTIVNLQSVADLARKNNARVLITGYADNSTGSEEINNTLSENRANVVAEKLIEMGVKSGNITIIANGGVDTLSPESHNRRVTIELTD